MSARDAILNKVRSSLGAGGGSGARRAAIEQRMAQAPTGVIPARGQLGEKERIALFCEMAEKAAATVHRVQGYDGVPAAVSAYLRSRNLPASVRVGDDERLTGISWDEQRALEIKRGPSDGNDEAGVSHAFGGVAETATVVLHSGKDNPTTINFLPDHHIVVVAAKDVAGDLETVLAAVRGKFGKGQMPRTLNLITGPSRSGDIEQKLLLGAHGPRALHLIVVEA